MTRSSYSQHHVLFTVCVSFVLFVFLGPVVSQGATYYVSLTGNDANSGTSTSAPFKTFARAVKPLHPGDTLYIRGGVWTQQISLAGTNINGSATGWIKISGYPGETVTIRYADPSDRNYGPIRARTNSYMIYENLVLDGINGGNDSGWLIMSDHIIIRNVEIKNFKANGLKIGANNIQVLNCKIHHQISLSGQPGERWYGIYHSWGSNNVIQGNKIYNNPGGGLHLYPGPISNLVVRNNVVHDNNFLTTSGVGGILVQGKSSTGVIRNTLIYNNIVHGNGMAQAVKNAPGIQVNGYTSGTKVWNNTVYGNRGYGINVYGGNGANTNTAIQNNIIYGNGINYANSGTGTIFTNNLTTDPKFVSTSSKNFQLQSSSPAIDNGKVLSNVTVDYKNTPRPRYISHDIGAYEY